MNILFVRKDDLEDHLNDMKSKDRRMVMMHFRPPCGITVNQIMLESGEIREKIILLLESEGYIPIVTATGLPDDFWVELQDKVGEELCNFHNADADD